MNSITCPGYSVAGCRLRAMLVLLVLSLAPELTRADALSFEAADFGLNPVFSDVQIFSFSIDLADPLTAGSNYTDPALIGVCYEVKGTLVGTPSGFPAFHLVRSIPGAEFYAQGSSLSFSVETGSNLADGLQVLELSGAAMVFEFDGREVGTGRYHPALFQLSADGTGSIRNSNNMGGINPASLEVVDVDFGEEYITELTFDPATLTLFNPGEASCPFVTITQGPAEFSDETTPAFHFSVAGGTAPTITECRVDGASFAACSSPFVSAALADGPHKFDVRVTDSATATGIDTVRWTVDTDPPGAFIDSAPDVTADPTPEFTFSADEEAVFECKVDAGLFESCTSPWNPLPLTVGAHQFSVHAIDPAGNSSGPAMHEFEIVFLIDGFESDAE